VDERSKSTLSALDELADSWQAERHIFGRVVA
jgi:hypothetical protein